jgi:hypothetical protein
MRYLRWSNSWIISLTVIYFAITFVLLIAEIKHMESLICFLRPIRVPLLMGLYFITSTKRKIIYFWALFFALISVIFFIGSSEIYLFFGSIAYMVYRFLTIVLIWKGIGEVHVKPLMIAILPFVFISLYLFFLIGEEEASINFYPLVINGLLLSLMGGLALYHYILEDNKNPWLVISVLLFVAQFFIFVIQKFYLYNAVFQPITATLFSICHYTFYRYLIKQESFAIEIQSP